MFTNQLALFELPATNRKLMPYQERDTFQMGDASETLTMARIGCWGHPVVKSSPGSVYDLIVDMAGTFLTVQVKSTSQIAPKMIFEIKRTSQSGGPRRFNYEPGDFDITAVVSLPDQKVLFFPGVHQRITCKREQFLRSDNEYASWRHSLTKVGVAREYSQ